MSTARMEEVATPQLSKPPLAKTSIVKQGILSILGSDSQRGKSIAASIRRTFSADMSSKQWLAQNGFFSPIKKIASSKDLLLSKEEEDDEINMPKTSFDVWGSILSQKKDDDNDMSNLQTPYIHPLVKRSTSSLSEKSLEICTENLGSESGSDGFSSYTPSENGDVDEDKDHQQQLYSSQSFEELRVVKYNYSKRSSSSFPPPIPSLARGDNNKPSLRMQSRRQDGTLILQAVSIPPQNLFHAHRHDGRLLLTFIDNNTSTSSSESEMDDYGEEFEQVFDHIDEHTSQFDYKSDDCPEQEEENGIIVMEQRPKLSSGVINMKKSALMMKLLDSPVEIREKSIQFPIGTKFPNFSPELEGHLRLGNKDLVTWPNKFNKIVNLTGTVDSTELTEKLSHKTLVPQSLPTQLTLVTATSFNAYEYFWRKKPTVASIVNIPTIAKEFNSYTAKQVDLASKSTAANAKSTTNVAVYEQQDLVLMRRNRANMSCLVPLQRGCKEPRRSLLIWEPYCIATS